MKKKILLALGFVLFPAGRAVWAQSIAGKVTDANTFPVEGATVVLQTIDSAFVDAAITDTAGCFRFDRQLPRYRLIFQHLLYETRWLECSDSLRAVVVLKSKNHELNEIVVKGERPLVKIEGGKLSYDLSSLASVKIVSNAYECLQQLPGVQEIDGRLSLAGAHSLHLILNGKPTTLDDGQLAGLLKNMPASRVDKAEIWYSAPPRYQVRGAVINVILKGYRPGEGGWQAEINAGYRHNYKPGAEGGISSLYTSPKWNIDFLYHARYEQNRQTTRLVSRHTLQDKLYNVSQQSIIDKKGHTHDVRLGAEYKLNEESCLSVAYTGAYTPRQKNRVFSDGNFAASHNSTRGNNRMHNAALDYISSFGLKAGVNYTSYCSESKQDFRNVDGENHTSRFQTESSKNIDRWKVYLDQSHEPASGFTLEYGTSLAYARDHNTQFYHTVEGRQMSALDTDNRYDEYTYTLYAGCGKSFGERLSFHISVTGEYDKMTHYHGWSVYPAAELTYVASPVHLFQLAFTSDKAYPAYWDLSESTGYLSGYEEIQGNPLLKPSADYSVSMNYIFRNKYIFNLSYDYEPDLFRQLAYQSPERLALIYKTLNWDYQQSISATAIIPLRIGNRLDSRLTLQAEHRRAKCDPFFDISFDHSKWIGLGMLENTLTLSTRPALRMQLTGLYLSPSIQGSYTLSKVWAVHAGLRWDFAGGKASLQLKANDIFNSMEGNIDVTLRNQGQNMDIHSNNYSRSLLLSFAYRWGGYKAKPVKQVDTSRFR